MSASAWVAGVDGCRGGWIVVLRRLCDPATAQLRLCGTFSEIVALPENPVMTAVDIPIGLPECVSTGGRPCDRAARAVLGGRQSSVFAVPARAAVMCVDYRDACAAALRTSNPPRKVSKQTFNLFDKIREVDALMTPALQEQIVECHPEVAFWALNGRKPLDLPKKVKSRPHPPGLELRRRLLENAGYCRELFAAEKFRRSEVGPDDVLDAAVNSWSAARIADGRGCCFPDIPERDGRGLRMGIWG